MLKVYNYQEKVSIDNPWFFAPSTMKAWGSRASDFAYETIGGRALVFVTSEEKPHDERVYTVRVFDCETGDLSTDLGDFGFGIYETRAEAHRAAVAAVKKIERNNPAAVLAAAVAAVL
jgi:hypothetical protein